MAKSVLNFKIPLLSGEVKDLKDYSGKVILVVNTASRCGFTPQYEGLEELYRMFKDQGFVVLAFPCNQFGAQEPGTEAEITEFLECNYTVSFPVFSKVDVNGENTHPFFEMLKEMAPGTMGTKMIKWNFTKFLISRDGKKVVRYASAKTPAQLKYIIATELKNR